MPIEAVVGIGVEPWEQLARNTAPKIRMDSRRQGLGRVRASPDGMVPACLMSAGVVEVVHRVCQRGRRQIVVPSGAARDDAAYRLGFGRMADMTKPSPARVRELNATIRYAMWSVFAVAHPLGASRAESGAGGASMPGGPVDRDQLTAEVEQLLSELGERDLVVRGVYDVAGLRADADVMIWWHAPDIETLQAAYQGLLRTRLGAHLEPVWSSAALHRPAEFNKSHIPAFLADEVPRRYVCVYPFVRSYDWYVLPETERRDMLREHGQLARAYPDVRANTIAAFALGDYEWLLAFEADDLHRIVDLMRELRASRARLHVREELPFFTGPRVELAELIRRLR